MLYMNDIYFIIKKFLKRINIDFQNKNIQYKKVNC